MKRIYFYAVPVLMALATACTKLNIDEVGEMGYDAGLGIPVCKFHASVIDILSKVDSTGNYVTVDSTDQSLHVFWRQEPQEVKFDVNLFESGLKTSQVFALDSIEAVRDMMKGLPQGSPLFMPKGVYQYTDTMHYDFGFDSQGDGSEYFIDSIWMEKAILNLGLDVDGMELNNNNRIELTIRMPMIADTTKSTIRALVTSNKVNVARLITRFLADFHDQEDGKTAVDIIMDYKIVSDGTAVITQGAKISYSVQFNFANFERAHGRFYNPKPLYEESLGISMPEALRQMKGNKLLFHNPELKITLAHNVGADLSYKLDYLRTLDSDGNELASARFDGGSKSYTDDLNRASELYDMAYDTIQFDRNNGHINELFEVMPDSLEMKCEMFVGKKEGGRNDFLVNPMKMFVGVEAHFEMQFDPGTEYTYMDTTKASLATLDTSFTNYVNIDEFCVMLLVKNSLPVAVTADVIFMDKEYQEIYRKSIQLEAPDVDEEGISDPKRPTEQDLKLLFLGDDIKAILGTEYICFKVKVSGHDSESMIAIHADNAVDLDVKAYAKFKANVAGLMK